MDIYQLIFIFISSLFIGSFYNVVAIRSLTGDEIIFDRSRCVYCEEKLLFFHMIPVFSYIILRGKCYYCNEEISKIYILGEIMTAIFFTIIVYRFGYGIECIVNLIMISILILSSITDLKIMKVSNRFILLGLFLVLIFRFIYDGFIIYYILSGIASFTVLYIIYKISGGNMGGGDVKIYGLIGVTIGFNNSMRSLFYASLIGIIFLLLYYMKGNQIKNLKIPFIPFISLGVILTYLI